MSMYDHELDRRVDLLAAKQAGAFNLRQVRAAGGGPNAASARIQLGVWLQLGPEVFATASSRGTYLRQCWAAVLGEREAWVGAFAAATFQGVPDFRPGRPEIVVPPGSNARSGLARVHRYAGAAVTTLRGLPITTPAQTIFDVAARVSVDRLERGIDHLLLEGRMSVADLDDRLTTFVDSRRPGLPILRLLISERRADGFSPPMSELERLGDRILKRLSGRPTVQREVSFSWLRGGAGRVDRFLPDSGIIIEFDGRRWHTRVQDFDADRWRDNEAAAAGLVVLRFTWAHVKLRPRDVLAVIERTRRARQRLSSASLTG